MINFKAVLIIISALFLASTYRLSANKFHANIAEKSQNKISTFTIHFLKSNFMFNLRAIAPNPSHAYNSM